MMPRSGRTRLYQGGADRGFELVAKRRRQRVSSDQVPAKRAHRQIDRSEDGLLDASRIGSPEQSSRELAEAGGEWAVEVLELAAEAARVDSFDEVFAAERGEETSVGTFAFRKVVERQRALDRCRHRVGRMQCLQKRALGAPDGADPHLGQEIVEGGEAVIDGTLPHAAGLGDSSDGS